MMARLRAECGWKAAQTHRTLAKHLLEETYETLEAIEALDAGGDPAHLCEELGDVLLQVYFHAAIAAESGWFDIEDVAEGLREKMLRRNPHVFGDVEETDPTGSTRPGRRSRRRRSSATDVLEGIPLALPALSRAAKVLDRLERAGREPDLADPNDSDPDLGDRLLALVDGGRAGRGRPRAGPARRRTPDQRVTTTARARPAAVVALVALVASALLLTGCARTEDDEMAPSHAGR